MWIRDAHIWGTRASLTRSPLLLSIHSVKSWKVWAYMWRLPVMSSHWGVLLPSSSIQCFLLSLVCLELCYSAWHHTPNPVAGFTNAELVTVLQVRPPCSSTPQTSKHKGPTLLSDRWVSSLLTVGHLVNKLSPKTLTVSVNGIRHLWQSCLVSQVLSHEEALGWQQHLHSFIQSTNTLGSCLSWGCSSQFTAGFLENTFKSSVLCSFLLSHPDVGLMWNYFALKGSVLSCENENCQSEPKQKQNSSAYYLIAWRLRMPTDFRGHRLRSTTVEPRASREVLWS